MNVTKRMLPRYRVEATKKVYGTKEKAYREAAKRKIASEFDHLGWFSADEEKASPAFKAFREKWCERDELSGQWRPTKSYKDQLDSMVKMMMLEDEEGAE